MISQIEVEQHENPGLCIHSHQGDQPHPYSNAHIVPQTVQQPDSPDGGKGNGQEDDHGFYNRLGVEIKQQEHDEDRDGDHQGQSLADALEVLILAAPTQAVTRWQVRFHFLMNDVAGLVHVAAQVAPGHIHVHVTAEQTVFVANHSRALHHADVRELGHWNLRSRRS